MSEYKITTGMVNVERHLDTIEKRIKNFSNMSTQALEEMILNNLQLLGRWVIYPSELKTAVFNFHKDLPKRYRLTMEEIGHEQMDYHVMQFKAVTVDALDALQVRQKTN